MTLVEQSASRPRARALASESAAPTASRSDRRWMIIRLAIPRPRESFHCDCIRARSAGCRRSRLASSQMATRGPAICGAAWRLLRQPALLARMQSQWKLSRGLGIANLMIIHRLSDLEAVGAADSEARALALGLLADCSTKIIYQQESYEAPRTAEVFGLSVTERNELPDVQRGEGLW